MNKLISVILILIMILNISYAFLNPIEIITRDFQALTRKVTAHHILLPKSDDVALALKQSIRNKSQSDTEPMYIVDAFSSAAKKYSRDEETAIRGGLLGTLVPQGYCRAKELDKACFEVPLGEIAGPIESEYGYHLLLVVERTNCKKLDGQYTRIRRSTSSADGKVTKIFEGDNDREGTDQMIKLGMQQVGFWVGVSFAGGVVAEVAAKASNVIETLPWE